jgi:hypothetical protein
VGTQKPLIGTPSSFSTIANSLAGLPKPKNIFIISSKTQGKIEPVADDFDLSSLLPQMSDEEEETLADKGYFMAAEYA